MNNILRGKAKVKHFFFSFFPVANVNLKVILDISYI